jgi:hypothetical protein
MNTHLVEKKTKKKFSELIYNRIKSHFKLKSNAELADFLGISTQAVSNSIARNSINWDNIFTKCEGLSIDWLLTGCGEKFRNNINQSIIGDNNVQAGNHSKIDARHYYSDSPDVLKAQIAEKEQLLAEKEARIKEKDSQIKEKDSQINKLLAILSNSNSLNQT